MPSWLKPDQWKLALAAFFTIQIILDAIGLIVLIGTSDNPSDGTRSLLTVIVVVTLVESVIGLVAFLWPRPGVTLTGTQKRFARLYVTLGIFGLLAEIAAIMMLQADMDMDWSDARATLIVLFAVFTIADVIGWTFNMVKE